MIFAWISHLAWLNFNPKVSLEFHGATIPSDAGLLAIRELDYAPGLARIAGH